MEQAKRINRWLGALLVSAPVIMSSVSAQASTHYERAPVIGVQPIYQTVTHRVPVEACYDEAVAYREPGRRSVTAPIIGAIIGGAVGNAVGSEKRNKQVGAVVGAVLGGSIAADVSRNRQRGNAVRYRTEQVCRTDYEIREEERISAYNVSYEYAGETYHTRMARDPGDYVRVRVQVTPAY